MTPGASIAALPDALRDRDELRRHLDGRRPAVFLDYDGTLTPIVDRPEDAVISESMRATVRGLAQRCPVCVVSGRDRRVVQDLMGVEDLIVPGELKVTPGKMVFSRPIRVAVGDEVCDLCAGDHHTFSLKPMASVGP